MTNTKMQVQLKDQLLLTYIIQQVVNEALGCELFYQNQVSDRARYPFVTYHFPSFSNLLTYWANPGEIIIII